MWAREEIIELNEREIHKHLVSAAERKFGLHWTRAELEKLSDERLREMLEGVE